MINYYDNDMQTLGYKKLYAEGIAGSTSFKDAFIKAEAVNLTNCVPASPAIDNVEVTTFEITCQGKFGPTGKSGDNDFDFTTQSASNNTLGIISYQSDAVCRYFANTMEMQGTVKPSVVQNERFPYDSYPPGPPPPPSPYIVTFDAQRWSYGTEWGLRKSDNQWEPIADHVQDQWVNDSPEAGKDITVSSSSHIYYSDGPGFSDTNTALKYTQEIQTVDFVNIFIAKIYGDSYQISDYTKWHTKTTVIADPNNQLMLIRGDSGDQLLGNGWIDIPIGSP